MYYAEIINNKVTFKTSTFVDGYEVIPDYVMPGWVKNIDGSFSIPAYTQEQVMSRLRFKRNQLLAATDWWVLPDRTPTQAQLDYRQALRDLPANSPNAALDENGQLINVTWPTPPE